MKTKILFFFSFCVLLSSFAKAQGNGVEIQEVLETFSNDNQNGSGTYVGGIGYGQVTQINTSTPATGNLFWNSTVGYSNSDFPFGVGYSLQSPNGYLNSTASGGTGNSTDSVKRLIYSSAKTFAITRTGKDISRFVFAATTQHSTTVLYPYVLLASGRKFNYGTGNSNPTGWNLYDITIVAGNNWHEVTNDGTNLIMSGAGVALPANDDIIGFGIYAYKPGQPVFSTISVDYISIYTKSTTLPIPASPTAVDFSGTSPSFSLLWTNVSGYSSASSYEYTIDGGLTYTTCSANPQTLTSASLYLPYQVGVRLKSVASTSTYSATAYATRTASADNLFYKETFPYMNNSSLSGNGWKRVHGSTATVTTSSLQSSANGSTELAGLRSFNAQYKAAGYVTSQVNTDRQLFETAYTNTTMPRTTAELEKLEVKVAVQDTGVNKYRIRVGVGVGTQLFVPVTSFSQTSSFTSWSGYETATWAITSGTQWYEVLVTETSSLTLSSTPVSLPSGYINRIVVYIDRAVAANNVVRFDDVAASGKKKSRMLPFMP